MYLYFDDLNEKTKIKLTFAQTSADRYTFKVESFARMTLLEDGKLNLVCLKFMTHGVNYNFYSFYAAHTFSQTQA